MVGEQSFYNLHGVDESPVRLSFSGGSQRWKHFYPHATRRVRVSGGAYGGFCDFDSHNGMFTFSSYRDPNLLKTVDVYDGERRG